MESPVSKLLTMAAIKHYPLMISQENLPLWEEFKKNKKQKNLTEAIFLLIKKEVNK